MSKGSGYGDFIKGNPVLRVDDVRRGQLLLAYNAQFDAENVMRVVEPAGFLCSNEKFYAHFVNPNDTDEPRAGSNGVVCVWEFELGERLRLWHAERAPAFPSVQS